MHTRPSLNRFGAKTQVENGHLKINGVERLKSASVEASDLRGGAALPAVPDAAVVTGIAQHAEQHDEGGFQPVAAFNYGAKNYRRVRSACLFTMAAGFCMISVVIVGCWMNGETLIRLFRDDPEVTAVALPAFRYMCLATVLQPVIVAGNMLFQSIGKAGRATFLSCCRQGIFFIPLILTLPRLFGLTGLELCQPIADTLTFLISIPLMMHFLRRLPPDETSG